MANTDAGIKVNVMPKTQPGFRLNGQLTHLIAIVLSIAAAYFMTIQSIKIDLAAKAESDVVGTLDKKLAGFEVLLREGVVSREQFYQFSRSIESRLIRIEDYLVDNLGENIGKQQKSYRIP
ncbi:MAG: hypothetical protein DRP45_02085 [Candidatus Zixiibacteriota bacterium]|nr:MAG: hypothetical protein DRP45_02085 [candidate division Zixibacteria bacterium]